MERPAADGPDPQDQPPAPAEPPGQSPTAPTPPDPGSGSPAAGPGAAGEALAVLSSFGRRLLVLVPVYLAGAMGLSVGFVLFGLALYLGWRRVRDGKEQRLRVARQLLDDEERLTAQTLYLSHRELPAWVSDPRPPCAAPPKASAGGSACPSLRQRPTGTGAPPRRPPHPPHAGGPTAHPPRPAPRAPRSDPSPDPGLLPAPGPEGRRPGTAPPSCLRVPLAPLLLRGIPIRAARPGLQGSPPHPHVTAARFFLSPLPSRRPAGTQPRAHGQDGQRGGNPLHLAAPSGRHHLALRQPRPQRRRMLAAGRGAGCERRAAPLLQSPSPGSPTLFRTVAQILISLPFSLGGEGA